MRFAVGFALALLLVTWCPAHDGARADPALAVHVNQVALERDGPKAAIVEYTGAGTPGRFVVLKDTAAVLTGPLVALPEFTEWGSGRRYFTADFSSLEVSGTYRLEVTVGDATARSPAFVIADHAAFATTVSAVLDY